MVIIVFKGQQPLATMAFDCTGCSGFPLNTCEAFGVEVGQAESELAAECIRNAHWEGSQAWTDGKWTVLNKSQFHHNWKLTYTSRGVTSVKDLEAWEEALRGLLKDVPAEDFYWNVKLHVPEEGFDIIDEQLIEVPFRVSPTVSVPAGALLRHGGRSYRVEDKTDVVLPTEGVTAHVDRTAYRWVCSERTRTEARTDGRIDNCGGEALPLGLLIACGIDVSTVGPARSAENYFGGL